MHRHFEEYLHALNLAADKQALREAIRQLAAELDLHSVAYISLPRTVKHKVRVISTYAPDWIDHYIARYYWRSDPVIGIVRTRRTAFEWGCDVAGIVGSEATRQFFGEAAAFGINYGFTVPIYDDGPAAVAAVTFATDRRTARFRKCINRRAEVLDFAACCLHFHVRQKLIRSYPVGNAALTPRQKECLELWTMGKTAQDISGILKIKLRTVIWHIENAKLKLGAQSISQATASFALMRAHTAL